MNGDTYLGYAVIRNDDVGQRCRPEGPGEFRRRSRVKEVGVADRRGSYQSCRRRVTRRADEPQENGRCRGHTVRRGDACVRSTEGLGTGVGARDLKRSSHSPRYIRATCSAILLHGASGIEPATFLLAKQGAPSLIELFFSQFTVFYVLHGSPGTTRVGNRWDTLVRLMA